MQGSSLAPATHFCHSAHLSSGTKAQQLPVSQCPFAACNPCLCLQHPAAAVCAACIVLHSISGVASSVPGITALGLVCPHCSLQVKAGKQAVRPSSHACLWPCTAVSINASSSFDQHPGSASRTVALRCCSLCKSTESLRLPPAPRIGAAAPQLQEADLALADCVHIQPAD